jgi:4-coumarate--CoA ligase (photoactive yellow protein activation family)
MVQKNEDDWRFGQEFPRFLADLIAAELAQMRPGSRPVRLSNEEDLGADSLEHLRLALAVTTALGCARPDRPDRFQDMRTLGQWVVEARRIAEGSDAGLAFKTSGSTGEPRFVAQEFSALAQEIEALAEIFRGAARMIGLVPAHHIYGFLFTVLLPGILNPRLRLPVLDGRAHSASSLASLLKQGDCVVAVPTFWQAAVEAGVDWPEGVVGVSSGAPCPPATGPALRRKGLARLVEVYGSTETGGIGWREDAEQAFRLLPYWTREDDARLAKDFGCGRQIFEIPDMVSWLDDRRLVPLRRRDGAVQIGGVNVYPEFVRAVLMSHPSVADAAVRAMAPHEGDRLKAFVVPKDGIDVENLREQLEVWLEGRLTSAQTPRAFSFGPRLPEGAQGKACDWPIRLAQSALLARPPIPEA